MVLIYFAGGLDMDIAVLPFDAAVFVSEIDNPVVA